MADAWQNIVQDVRVELNALAAAAAPGASVAAVILGLNHTVQLGTPLTANMP